MPGMGGIAAMQAIRAGRAGATCPIVAFTGDGDGDVARKDMLLAKGFCSVLNKPLTVADLHSCVLNHGNDGLVHEENRQLNVA